MPYSYGNWKSVYNRYYNWAKKGPFEKIIEVLKKRWRLRWNMMDATIVRVHQHSNGGKGGKKLMELVGGLTTKIHVKVDAFGMLLKIEVSSGNRQVRRSIVKYVNI